MSLLNTASTNNCQVLPYGQLMTGVDGNAVFTDTFDFTTIDTSFRWNTPVVAGSATASVANSILSLTCGTTASNAAALTSQQSYTRLGFGWLKFGCGIQVETPQPSNTHQFWGVGTPNASFTAVTPLTDAVGFEVDILGNMSAVIYAGSTRVFQKVLPYPTDGKYHSYITHIRDDFIYWYVDNAEIPVASSSWITPNTATLPLRFHSINGTSTLAATNVFNVTGVGLADSSRSGTTVYNGTVTDKVRTPNKFINLNAVAISTETTIWTPATGKRFRIMGFILTSGTVAGNVILKDNTGGTTIMILPFGAVQVPLQSPVLGNGLSSITANNVLTATGSSTQTLSGFIYGTEE